MVVLAVLLVNRSVEYLGVSDLSVSGVVGELEQTAERSSHGGSAFTPTIVTSPLQLPYAAATVLFRPFPFEAHNAQALAASLEGLFLFLLLVVRWRWAWNALKRLRVRPYIAFAAVYTLIFIVAFASFPNFGLLARERVMMLPFYLLFVSIPPPARESERQRQPAQQVSDTALPA